MSSNANLFAHFKRHFPSDHETELLATADGRSVSYREADEASARIANCLIALGAKSGDRVTVQVEKSVENLFLYLACLRAGLVYHPLNTAYKASELEYFLGNAEPTIVVCDADSLATIELALSATEAGPGVNALLTLNADGNGTLTEKAETNSADFEAAEVLGSDMAALLYSSGTTGQPKGIMLSHDNLRKNAETLVSAWGFTADRPIITHVADLSCSRPVCGCELRPDERCQHGLA